MTKIEWVSRPGTKPESWNPIAGCTKVSPGCNNCYALRDSWRIIHAPRHPERYDGVVEKTPEGDLAWTGTINLDEEELERPLRWQKQRTVFVCSMSDLFHHGVPTHFIERVFDTIIETPQHTYMVLTKRSNRMRKYIAGRWPPAYYIPNLWLGVTVEEPSWRYRIKHLVDSPAALRYVSIEPMVTSTLLDLTPYLFRCSRCKERPYTPDLQGQEWHYNGHWTHRHGNEWVPLEPSPQIDWVLLGGESGPQARRFYLDHARTIIADCHDAGVPVFVKQLGSWWAKGLLGKDAGRKGQHIEVWPHDLQVREWPRRAS